MLGKKFGALMVLMLFVVSTIPLLAFAQENTQEDTADTSGSVRIGHGKDVTETPHQKDIRDKSRNAQENFVRVKEKLTENRGRVASCIVNSGLAGCSELLTQDLQDRKDYLLNAVDRIEAVLDSLEDKAQHISDVTERDEMIAHIKDRRDALHELVLKVESVQDRAGLKAVRDEFVDLYKDIKQTISEYTVATRLDNLHGINQKLIALNTRLQNIANALEKVGVSLADSGYAARAENLQKAIDDAQADIELARQKYQHAVELKNSGASKEEVQGAIAEAKSYLAKVKENVRNANNHARDIITAFKNKASAEQLNTAIAETAEE